MEAADSYQAAKDWIRACELGQGKDEATLAHLEGCLWRCLDAIFPTAEVSAWTVARLSQSGVEEDEGEDVLLALSGGTLWIVRIRENNGKLNVVADHHERDEWRIRRIGDAFTAPDENLSYARVWGFELANETNWTFGSERNLFDDAAGEVEPVEAFGRSLAKAKGLDISAPTRR